MGMFDTVVFRCPYCADTYPANSALEFQSKGAAVPLLERFDGTKKVPTEVAADLRHRGTETKCKGCGRRFRVKVKKKVRVRLVEVK